MRLSSAGQQVVSCQRNSLETLQETYIVLYKLSPRKKKKTIPEERQEGGADFHLETNGSKL